MTNFDKILKIWKVAQLLSENENIGEVVEKLMIDQTPQEWIV